MATWRDVRRYAVALDGVSERQHKDGRRLWYVKDKLFAWERPLRKADLEALGDKAPTGPVLGLRTPDLEMKEVLLASDPAVFFTTPHFDGYAAVLVRLEKIGTKTLKDAIAEAWSARAARPRAKRRIR